MEDYVRTRKTLRVTPLSHLIKKSGAIKEFLGKSGTAGIAGAAYLIPDKIYDIYFEAARATDIVPLVSNFADCPGSTLKVDVEIDGQFVPHFFTGGGAQPTETMATTYVEITPRLFGISPQITYELIEDSQWDVMEMHLRNAGKEMGQLSTKMWLYLPLAEHAAANTYGADGVLNIVSAGGAWCYMSDVQEADDENWVDGYKSDTIVYPPMINTMLKAEAAASMGNYQDWFQIAQTDTNAFGSMLGKDFIRTSKLTTLVTKDAVHKTAGLYDAHWHTLVFNKENASLTVRKRWLKIENFSNPIKDLVGSAITSRQNSELLYRDAMCVISWA